MQNEGCCMTAIPQSGTSSGLSDRIARPLRAVRARQWNVLAALGALRTVVAAMVVLAVAALLLGSFGGMPAWLRVSVAGAAWVLILVMSARFVRPVLRRGSLS